MIHPKNNSSWQSAEISYQNLFESIAGYQLTVIAGRPESDGEIFFDKFMTSVNFLVFNFETGWLSIGSGADQKRLEMLPSEFSAFDVFEKYKSLRSSYPIDGIGLFRVQFMHPICKEEELIRWNNYQRPIDLITLSRRVPLPIVAFSALNKTGQRLPVADDLRAEYRILATLADRICLVHANGSEGQASIVRNQRANELIKATEFAEG